MGIEQERKLSGAERAAILLMTLGEQGAAEVIRHLDPKEVHAVGQAMAATGGVSWPRVGEVLQECLGSLETETSLGLGTEDYLRNVMTRALGDSRAATLLDRILPGHDLKGFQALKWMEPRAIAEVLRLEHPQVVAVVFSCLEPHQTAEVLAAMPEDMQSDLLMRVASLDGIQPRALRELDDVLEKQFSGRTDHIRTSGVGGEGAAAEILNNVDGPLEYSILDRIRERDPALGRNIEERMFGFENLADMDGRGIQSLLREVSTDTLVTALKGADERVKYNVFRNMSKRAGEVLREDLEARGPVRLGEVEAARKEVLAIARRMQEAGDLFFVGGGNGFV